MARQRSKHNRFENIRPGTLVIALFISVVLWGIANGVSSTERAYDVSVEIQDLGEDVVVTDQTPDAINVRIMGSQASLRNIDAMSLVYPLDLTGSKPGDADFEVDTSRIRLPAGARIVSRSPSRILLHLEPRGRKAVGVRVETSGEPAAGFTLKGVDVAPDKVWVTGVRSKVLRLDEIVTEKIDLDNLTRDTEFEAIKLVVGTGNVWMEKSETVSVVLRIGPKPIPPPETETSDVDVEVERKHLENS
jgi:YbbR domain-containing protein